MEGDETEGSWRFWMKKKKDGKDHEREEDEIMFT
jgi:hypothetical protein